MGKNKCAFKLLCKAGESIAETLIALLISSLALMMLAGAVSSAARIIQSSKASVEDYYKKDNEMIENPDKLGPLSVEFTLESGTAVKFKESTPSVNYNMNQKFSNHPIVSYTLIDETPSGGDGS